MAKMKKKPRSTCRVTRSANLVCGTAWVAPTPKKCKRLAKARRFTCAKKVWAKRLTKPKTTKRKAGCSARERNRAHDRGMKAFAAFNRRCK